MRPVGRAGGTAGEIPRAAARTARIRLARLAAWVGLLTCAVTGCSSGGPSSTGSSNQATAPTLQVLTSLYPLAQAVDLIGNGKASAVDVVPAGANPLTYRLNASQIPQVKAASLAILATPGFQPLLDQAATNVTYAGAGLGEPYFWLDPPEMRKAVTTIAAAMERADPSAAHSFRDGATALQAELDSTGIDYESTLSTCPRRTVFAADQAFSAVAKRYNLDYYVLGTAAPPDPSSLNRAIAAVGTAGATTVFTEPWVSSATPEAVAARAHVKVRVLDTLLGPPPGGWPRQASYLNLLESNLGALANALGCAGPSSV